MKGKAYFEWKEAEQSRLSSFRTRLALREQRKKMKVRLFGDHYNYDRIGINKEKKYWLQEQKNTEIERANRILLQKIQSIAKRNNVQGRKRTITQHSIVSSQHSHCSHQSLNRRHEAVTRTSSLRNRINIKKDIYSPRILFKGVIEVNGQEIPIATSIANDKFILTANLGHMLQKILLNSDQYEVFFGKHLKGDHERIIDFLKMNGSLLVLQGIKKQIVTIEEHNELLLPPLESKQGSRPGIIEADK